MDQGGAVVSASSWACISFYARNLSRVCRAMVSGQAEHKLLVFPDRHLPQTRELQPSFVSSLYLLVSALSSMTGLMPFSYVTLLAALPTKHALPWFICSILGP
jgi:hypothetical protein